MPAQLKPRRYVCRQRGCPWRERFRLVYPIRFGEGMVSWAVPHCECSQELEMVLLNPGDPELAKQ